jgi:hypothetical protein
VSEDKKPAGSKPTGGKPGAGKPEVSKAEVGAIPIPRPFPIPILINPNPVISSLSPVGAIVGGGDFTLSIFGSNFNASSAVQWNQANRPATFISPTQLTAQITAADISAIISVTITVSNPGILLTVPVVFSNGVPFSIVPDISAIVAQLQNIPANPPALLAELNTWVTLKQAQVDSLSTQVTSDNSSIATLQSQVANLQNTNAQQATTISQLQSQIAAGQATNASPLDVAQSFKSVVDQIQQQARNAGGVQTTLTNMNIQLKTLISVQPGSGTTPPQAVLAFPSATAPPDPNLLSTMTLAFGAIPNVNPGTATPPPPPAAAPPPAPPPPAPPAPPGPPAPVVSSPAAAKTASVAPKAAPASGSAKSQPASAPPKPTGSGGGAKKSSASSVRKKQGG